MIPSVDFVCPFLADLFPHGAPVAWQFLSVQHIRFHSTVDRQWKAKEAMNEMHSLSGIGMNAGSRLWPGTVHICSGEASASLAIIC